MNRHFAKLGDVWKHLPLAEVLRLNPPLHFWETHAGSAVYPLTESPPRLHGALRFIARAAREPELERCTYLRVLREMPHEYPGSAMLAMRLLGRAARYLFCDIDPESVRSLRDAGALLDVRVVECDGVSTIAREAEAADLEPSRVLVHIDPFLPHERLSPDAMTPIELAAWLARQGFRLLYWYGYDQGAERGWARREIARRAPGVDLWCGDVLIPAPFVYPERRGMSADDILSENDPPRMSFAVI